MQNRGSEGLKKVDIVSTTIELGVSDSSSVGPSFLQYFFIFDVILDCNYVKK